MAKVNLEHLIDAKGVAEVLKLKNFNSVFAYKRRYEDMLRDLKAEGFENPKLFRTCAQRWVDYQTAQDGAAGGENGKPVGPVGPKGQVRDVQFTSGGFQIVAAPKPSLPLDNPI